MTPTQLHQQFADLIDDGTADGRNMLWRQRRRVRRWDEFLEVSGVFAALALFLGIAAGCGWIVWEVCSSAVSMVSSIFN